MEGKTYAVSTVNWRSADVLTDASLDETEQPFRRTAETLDAESTEMAQLRAQANRWAWLDNPRITDAEKVNWLAAVLEARREGWPDPPITTEVE